MARIADGEFAVGVKLFKVKNIYMEEKLLALRKKVIGDYKNAQYRIVSDYKNEIAITKDYNSRQLLEMLQNADDANSTNVLIDWDSENQILKIHNRGNEFSYEGFESLMISNYTSKTSGVFIGNKGLGFRSLLNWGNEISVYSAGCKVSFSKCRAESVLVDEIRVSEDEILKLNERGGFSVSTKPFPIMAAPEIISYSLNKDWNTIVEIKYHKEYEKSIDSQINQLTEEILLFLNNIECIKVIKNKDALFTYQSRKEKYLNHNIIHIGDKQWNVFGDEDDLPNELQDSTKSYRQRYSLRIAFQDDLSDNYKQLFNYFPTKVNVHLPCILHGTFELNNSRDHLNESDVNRFIIKEFTKLFHDAIEFLKLKDINWLPHTLISPTKTDSDSSIIPLLYSELKIYSEKEKIFPCINDTYQVKSDVYFYSNDFNAFILKNLNQYFPHFVHPGNGISNIQLMDIKELEKIINEIGCSEISIELRAELIYSLSKIINLYGRDYTFPFNILINKDDKVIPSEEVAFTPILNDETNFEIPHRYVSLDIINTQLYNSLNNNFKENYKRGEVEARELQRNIRAVTNLQPYDSSNVIDKIITSFKQYINKEQDIIEKKEATKQMVKTLFSIYKGIDRKIDVLNQSIQLLNCDGEIVNSNDLYLGLSYSSEKIVTYCYEGVLNESDYLEKFSYWEINEEDKFLSENFFKWLGVNCYFKIEKINLTNKWEYSKFYKIIQNEQLLSTDFNATRILQKTKVTRIANFEELLKSISTEKLLLLAYFEPIVKWQILENSEDIEWSFSNSTRVIKTEVSFINYQFINSGIFDNLLLQSFSPDVNRFLNAGLLDYELIKKFGIEKLEIDKVLSKLGAKNNINELSVSRVFEILKCMPEIDEGSDGSGTLTLYSNILDNLSNQDNLLIDDLPKDNLLFYGKRGEERGYYKSDDLNYISNPIFSNQILKSIALVNLPKRINETNILKFFGIKSLKEKDISIDFVSLKYNPLNNSFTEQFENYKPYLLLYRLFSNSLRKPINEESQRILESNLIKNLNINLVNNLIYNFKDKDYSLSVYDFIANGNDYYINIPKNITRSQDIFADSLICDAISEILCVQFKINELKSDFRFVVKNDLKDTEHITSTEFADYKSTISSLMGVSRSMLLFWNNIFEIKNHPTKDFIFKNERELQIKINEVLGFDFEIVDVDYDRFSDQKSYELICKLNLELNLAVKDIRKDGILNWHIKNLKLAYFNDEININSAIWRSHSLKKALQSEYITNTHNIKEQISSTIDVYFVDNESIKFDLYPDYLKILRSIVGNYLDVHLLNEDPIEPKILYDRILAENKIDKNELDIHTQSLLYFAENEIAIEEYINNFFNAGDTSEPFEEFDDDDDDFKVVDDSSLKIPKNSTNFSIGKNSIWNNSKRDDDRNRIIGKNAEKVAYKALIKKYGKENVFWLSSNSDTPHRSDTLHYDIKYKNEFGFWKKLEVKNYNGNYFKISKDELNLGIDESKEFEIGLVNNKRLFVIKDLFAFENNDNLYKNSKFRIESNNYTIFYSLEHD